MKLELLLFGAVLAQGYKTPAAPKKVGVAHGNESLDTMMTANCEALTPTWAQSQQYVSEYSRFSESGFKNSSTAMSLFNWESHGARENVFHEGQDKVHVPLKPYHILNKIYEIVNEAYLRPFSWSKHDEAEAKTRYAYLYGRGNTGNTDNIKVFFLKVREFFRRGMLRKIVEDVVETQIISQTWNTDDYCMKQKILTFHVEPFAVCLDLIGSLGLGVRNETAWVRMQVIGEKGVIGACAQPVLNLILVHLWDSREAIIAAETITQLITSIVDEMIAAFSKAKIASEKGGETKSVAEQFFYQLIAGDVSVIEHLGSLLELSLKYGYQKGVIPGQKHAGEVWILIAGRFAKALPVLVRMFYYVSKSEQAPTNNDWFYFNSQTTCGSTAPVNQELVADFIDSPFTFTALQQKDAK